MSSSVDANVFKVRHHSAIIIDAPILISFTLPYSAYVFAYMFIYQLSQKTVSKVVRLNGSSYSLYKANVTHLTLCSLREIADATKALLFGIEV